VKVNRGREAGATSMSRSETFTGTVLMDPVMQGIPDTLMASVSFPPGARTDWHHHERGQILIVTSGAGYARTRAGQTAALAAGDVVYFEPGEEHWHGAGPDSYLVHIAISLGTTSWLDEKVSDEDYALAREG
jgi:quercetin dioxygenase-like cupin family protein